MAVPEAGSTKEDEPTPWIQRLLVPLPRRSRFPRLSETTWRHFLVAHHTRAPSPAVPTAGSLLPTATGAVIGDVSARVSGQWIPPRTADWTHSAVAGRRWGSWGTKVAMLAGHVQFWLSASTIPHLDRGHSCPHLYRPCPTSMARQRHPSKHPDLTVALPSRHRAFAQALRSAWSPLPTPPSVPALFH